MYQIEKVVTYLRTGFRPWVLAPAALMIFEYCFSFSAIDSINLRIFLQWLVANPTYYALILPDLFAILGRIAVTFLSVTVFSFFAWIFATHRKDLEFTASSVVMLCASFVMVAFAFAFAGLFALPVWLLAIPGVTLCLLETWRMRAMADNYN